MITGSLSSAPPSLALSGGNNTREHTYSRNERTTEKERESKEGGGQEKEVAYELQGYGRCPPGYMAALPLKAVKEHTDEHGLTWGQEMVSLSH
ncbi:hairy and enhancer of split 5 [Sarotherodon galilaeus]